MTALGARISEMIQSEGPIPLDRFMSLALQDPRHGYYMTRDPFGAGGDFVTAPEISQMFGELLGLWALDLWLRMGRPPVLRLIELGPGRGTLMADVLRAARINGAFLKALDLRFIETSPFLAERQRTLLGAFPGPAAWHANLDDVPHGPAIVFANEFFDALPVRQYVRTPEGWRERVVGLDEQDCLAFALAAEPERAIKLGAPVGAVLEVGLAARRIMAALARRLVAQGGCALVVDYGYVRSGLGETLQALERGAPVDPLRGPGEADLTVHVDFSALRQAATAAGAVAHGPVEQGVFLNHLGIEQRAARLARDANTDQRAAIEAAAARLVDRSSDRGMGALFKVLAVRAPAWPTPAGFDEEEAGFDEEEAGFDEEEE